MAYGLEPDENPADGLKRIALEQLDQAIGNAVSADMARDEDVHDVRKCMKKLRAVLRMARAELGESTFRRENTCFREAAKRLSGLREAAVRVSTAEKLQRHFTGQAIDVFAPLLDNLRAQAEAVRAEHLDQGDALSDVASLRSQSARTTRNPAVLQSLWQSVAGKLPQVAALSADTATAIDTVSRWVGLA